MSTNPTKEIRIGVVVAFAGAAFTALFAVLGWVGVQMYITHGQVSALSTDTADTKQTTHEILTVLLNKTQISVNQTADNIK